MEDLVRCRLKTGYKTKNLWASFDGVDRYEIFKDKAESIWVATVYLEDNCVDYFWMKTAPKPNLDKYQLIIPTYPPFTDFKLLKVSWTY